jgi:hypothetical protein
MAASLNTEMQFVALFWRLALAGDGNALRIAKHMRPGMLKMPGLSTAFRCLLDRFAVGSLQDDDGTQLEIGQAIGIGGVVMMAELYELAVAGEGLRIGPYATEILDYWRAERIALYLTDEAKLVTELVQEDPSKALAKANEAMVRALAMQEEGVEDGGPQSRTEYAEAERAKLTAKGVIGASWPYPKMQRVLGHIRPGKLYGISSLPGVGKSTFLANLFNGWVRRGQPVIVAPTEMRDEWLSRAYAAASGVPQEIAENALWDYTDREMVRHLAEVRELRGQDAEALIEGALRVYRDDYARTIDEFEKLPWEVISGADLSVDEIIARLGILRRRYSGQFVIAAVDHLHNLSYPGGEVDKHVGAATRRLREYCQEDRDGGMAIVALFQPRKPDKQGGDTAQFRPLPAQEVRGQVAQVLDVHMSIYHQRVRIDPSGRLTPWGTPAGLVDPETGYPIRPQKGDDPKDVKDDDERLYVKPDKRRRHGGSRSTATFILNINAETGAITELDRHRMLRAM